MTDRAALTAGLIILGLLLYYGWQAVQRRRLNGLLRTGRPTLLHLSRPDCAPCAVQQAPAVDALRSEFGERIIVNCVDVTLRPELAARWRVLTVPTTVNLNPAGQVCALNTGVAQSDKLRRQLLAAGC